MMTIVTHVTLKEGSEPEWDTAMKARLQAAREQTGWISGQLAMPLDGLNRRIIIGTWQTRADWETWHNDPKFRVTRQKLEGLEAGPSEHWWHEVLEDGRRTVTPLAAGSAAAA